MSTPVDSFPLVAHLRVRASRIINANNPDGTTYGGTSQEQVPFCMAVSRAELFDMHFINIFDAITCEHCSLLLAVCKANNIVVMREPELRRLREILAEKP